MVTVLPIVRLPLPHTGLSSGERADRIAGAGSHPAFGKGQRVHNAGAAEHQGL